MIIVDCVQGSEAWVKSRLGRPTASQFHRILSPKTRKLSTSAAKYRSELLAEIQLNAPLEGASSGWMQRGRDMEQKAVEWYELMRDVDVQRVGFCLRDDRRVGCSPDGLVGSEGGLEVKCLSAAHHSECVTSGESPAKATQVQGGLWITGRDWWDVLAFNPTLPSRIYRVHRDEKYIAALAAAVDVFLTELDRDKKTLEALRDGRAETPLAELLAASLNT